MFKALLVSVYYLLVSAYMSLWPALIIGWLVHLVAPNFEVIAFGAVFAFVLTEFIFRRKGNWIS